MPQAEKSFIVTNTTARLISIAGQDILPGKTSAPIAEKLIAGVKKSPAYRAGWLKEGVVEMPPPKIVDITKATPEEAIKLISTESDLRILNAWAEAEKRPAVLQAISERVKQL